jgi:phosphatidylserine/phosphatidylglycerophosphate/cardiolipin synthase-like enzyme
MERYIKSTDAAFLERLYEKYKKSFRSPICPFILPPQPQCTFGKIISSSSGRIPSALAQLREIRMPVAEYKVSIGTGNLNTLAKIAGAMNNNDPPFNGILIPDSFWDPATFPATSTFTSPWQFLSFFNFGSADPIELSWFLCIEYGLEDANILPSQGKSYSFKGGEVLYIPISNESTTGRKNEMKVQKRCDWFCTYLPVSSCQSADFEFFVDAEEYSKKLLLALNAATEEICLTGLHFVGHFNLNRNTGQKKRTAILGEIDDPDSLRSILAERSLAGVDIYVIVNQFWDDEITINENCRELGKNLEDPGKIDIRVKIARSGLTDYLDETYAFFKWLHEHGDSNKIHAYTDVHQGIIFHSNHQKTIIIDRKVAFIGGVDLTDIDGDRWDNDSHETNNVLRNYNKPERNWHDCHFKMIKKSGAVGSSAVDYIFANFLARFNYGYLLELFDHDKRSIYPPLPPTFPIFIQPQSGAKDYVSEGDWIWPHKIDFNKATNPYIQIVRSMPMGKDNNYEKNQCPKWNRRKDKEFECSVRDAYLIGIKAAREFIYLENQWIVDSHIWDVLIQKAREMAHVRDFYIIIVLPKKFLAEAGYGHEQSLEQDFPPRKLANIATGIIAAASISTGQIPLAIAALSIPPLASWLGIKGLYGYVKELADIFEQKGNPENFGLYSILQPNATAIPVERWRIPECSWDYTYVHSKILIVDDKWCLIGSANAGGISLTGILTEKQPDTELSAIILDPAGQTIRILEKSFGKSIFKFQMQVITRRAQDFLGQTPKIIRTENLPKSEFITICFITHSRNQNKE